MQEVLAETMAAALVDKPSEDLAKKSIAIVDKLTEIFLRVLPRKEVAAFIPEDMAGSANVAVLKDAGASDLAALCEFTTCEAAGKTAAAAFRQGLTAPVSVAKPLRFRRK